STNAPSARQAEKRFTAPTQCSIRTNDQIEMIPSTPRVSVNVFAAGALGSGIEGTIAWYTPELNRISSIAMARQICGTCDQATAARTVRALPTPPSARPLQSIKNAVT